MSENSSKNLKIHWLAWLLILPVWTYAAFWLAQFVVVGIQELLIALGAPLASINQVLYTTIVSVIIYIIAVLIVVFVPWFIFRRRTSRVELGAPDLPAWLDLALTVPAYIVYMICTAIVMMLAVSLIPGIDLNQAQELPFSQTMLTERWQYALVFFTLVILAPLAEELLFRGYLYGKLRKTAPIWVAIIVTSLAFGAAHLWGGPGSPLQWAVAIDTMVLGVILALLREYTGAVWASVLVHALKNGIAFYLLFMNPQLIDQLRAAILPFL